VLAVREPDNPYDSHAVRLEAVGGEQLGYVPRVQTGYFKSFEVCAVCFVVVCWGAGGLTGMEWI